MFDPKRVVITGASGGLGQALVKKLASPGRSFLLLGRDSQRLQTAKEGAEAAQADAQWQSVSLCQTDLLKTQIDGFAAGGGIDLLIVNAGVKTGNIQGREAPGQAARVVGVNLTGAIETVELCLPHLLQNAGGHIVLICSLAGVSPQPDLLSYSATKAGLSAYGVALRRQLRGAGVTVGLVVPGFIATPMTERHIGRTPFCVSSDTAALKISRAIYSRAAFCTFPWQLAVATYATALMPRWLSDWANARLAADILPDEDEKNPTSNEG